MAKGRAKTPEEEEFRREKIRFAVKQRAKYRDSKGRFISTKRFMEELRERKGVTLRAGNVHVLIISDYRKRNPRFPQRLGIDYEVGREYSTYIDPGIASNPSALQSHLNQLRPNRVHFRARVVQYL
jgi:hypothetical protein